MKPVKKSNWHKHGNKNDNKKWSKKMKEEREERGYKPEWHSFDYKPDVTKHQVVRIKKEDEEKNKKE